MAKRGSRMISSWSLFGRQWRRNRGVVLTANPSEVANLSRLHATQIIQVTPANLKVLLDFQFSTILTRWTDGWDYAWISSVINSINFSLMQLPRIFLAQSEDFQERGGSEKKCKKVFFEAVQSVIINLKGQFFKMKSFKKESDYDSRIWNLCFCNRRKARVCLPAIMEEPAQRALPAVILQTFFFIGSQNFSWEQLGNCFFLISKCFHRHLEAKLASEIICVLAWLIYLQLLLLVQLDF